MNKNRLCSNCCFCILRNPTDPTGTCAMTKKLVQKTKTADELKCKYHLYRAEN